VIEQLGLAGLFAAFLAATILPLESGALLVALLAAGERPAWQLLAAASLGNTLGGRRRVGRWAAAGSR